jgi:hypothetical protein
MGDRPDPAHGNRLTAPTDYIVIPLSVGFFGGQGYQRDLIGKRVLAGIDPTDGIFGPGRSERAPPLSPLLIAPYQGDFSFTRLNCA